MFLAGLVAQAEDWPTYNHDISRSGVSNEKINTPLKEAWSLQLAAAPEPSWPGPAKQDYFHRHFNLRPTVTFDRAFHLVGAGHKIYFGSSADCKIYAVDAESGSIRWTYFTGGPVRIAPVVSGERLYAGSDDGFLYCLAISDGSLIWKYNAAETPRMIPGNGRIISMYAIRSGIIVDGGTVYFAAGLFPTYGAYLVALDADTGEVKYRKDANVSPQGYMLASDEMLYIPTGRTSPVMFERTSGANRGALPSGGGSYGLLSSDILVTGPGRVSTTIHAADARNRNTIATFSALRMLAKGSLAYMHSETRLRAFDRQRYIELSRRKNNLTSQVRTLQKQISESSAPSGSKEEVSRLRSRLAEIEKELPRCTNWDIACEYPHAAILAGDTIFAGGEDRIAAFSTENGKILWTAPVAGDAYSIIAVNGRLLVSTGQGRIYCFERIPKRAGDHLACAAGNPYSRDELTGLYQDAADRIIKQTKVTQGYCLVLDAEKGRLAYELAKRTDLKIVGVESSPAKAAQAREAIDKAELYGRVVIFEGELADLNLTSFFANLIVSDAAVACGKNPKSPEEVGRLLRPEGGTIFVFQPNDVPEQCPRINKPKLHQWYRTATSDQQASVPYVRGPLPGAGEWTHQHADAGQTACSKDKLVRSPVELQWFGRPGPRTMIDRHHRNVAPLYKNGRLFVPGDQIVYAVDAYNGTVLYDIKVPDSRRLGVFLDCSNLALDDNYLYVAAGDKCLSFDVRTGKQQKEYTIAQAADQQKQWGFLAYQGDTLFGSVTTGDAHYTATSYDADLALWYRNMKLVVSESLFALDKPSGADLWRYKKGLIVNTTISAAGDKIFFIETRGQKALKSSESRLAVKTLFDGAQIYLTALDHRTGRTVYSQPVDLTNIEEPVYLNCSDGIVLVSGSRLENDSVVYHYYAFAAADGIPVWSASHNSELRTDGGHGEYNRHPTIIGDTVYAWPYAYNLKSGARIKGWKFSRRGHGCGGVSASASAMFWRGYNPWMYDLRTGGGPVRLNAVSRPGCWINTIPAGGLILLPEASSGCTCGFPIQTSMAFIPQGLSGFSRPAE